MQLEGKVALVTGGQQGIGAAIGQAFAAEGAFVVLNYLDDRDAASRVAAKSPSSRPMDLVAGSVTRRADVAAMLAACDARGGIDVLVNNAGIFPRSAILDLAEAEWDAVIDVNLKGAFRCIQAAARSMVHRGGGSIINIASVVADAGIVGGAHYVASKAGMAGLTRAAALELAPHRIRVNAIAPGVTDTAQPRLEMTDAELEAFGAALPLGRLTEPGDVAHLAVYLAGNVSRQVTGQTMHVNGGQFFH
jgi:3-oxoacyl-[acyl-carrier protein] reductase